MIDKGSQHIKITGTTASGDATGIRHDGARIVITAASPDKAGSMHVRNMTPTFVDRLYFNEILNDREIQACQMMQEHYYEAGMEPRVCASYKAVQTGGKEERSDRQEGYYRRYTDAVRSLGDYNNTVIMAVLHDNQPNSIARLKDGLKLLIGHYGI